MHYTLYDIPILNSILQKLSICILKICGWHREGPPLDIPQFVLIAAPHTSNWDLPIGLAIVLSYKLNFRWLGKDSLFRWPFGAFFKWLGGIPVDRSKSNNVVAQSIQVFRGNEKIIMAVAPEGTRGKAKYWKAGFYHIARGANVPIVMGFLDYARKVGGFGPVLIPTGDIELDLKKIRCFYGNITGKNPDKTTPANIAPPGG
jgi:1-acyl-sn-glycerol-3-phosphate acyltransferase